MYKDYPAAYQVSKGSALQVDKPFYDRVRERQDARTLIESFEVPIRTGRASGRPCVPCHRAGRSAGRRLQYLERPRSARTPVGSPHPAIAGCPREHLRPA